MNEKITKRRNQLKGDLVVGRINVYAALAMTALNLILRLCTKSIALPFSIYLSDLLFTLGVGSAKDGGAVAVLPIFFGVMIIVMLALCCRLSAKRSEFMKIVHAAVWIDFIINGLMAIYLFVAAGSFVLILNFAYHFYLTVTVGKAAKAAVGLELIPECVDEEPSDTNNE